MKKRGISILLLFALLCGVCFPAAKAATMKFTDVPADADYYDAVMYCVEHGLIKGKTSTTFGPSGTLTRGQVVTILGRMENVDFASYKVVSGGFKDVSASSYFNGYVYWAKEKGIVTGYSKTTFKPSMHITREQMAAIVSRYLTWKGVALPDAANATPEFTDASSMSKYAVKPMEICRKAGLFMGDANGYVYPQKELSRAEAAVILMKVREGVLAAGGVLDGTGVGDQGNADEQILIEDFSVELTKINGQTYQFTCTIYPSNANAVEYSDGSIRKLEPQFWSGKNVTVEVNGLSGQATHNANASTYLFVKFGPDIDVDGKTIEVKSKFFAGYNMNFSKSQVPVEPTLTPEEQIAEAQSYMTEEWLNEVRVEFFRLLNEARKDAGLEGIAMTDDMTRVAQLRAEECTQLYEHTRPNGTRWITALQDLGIDRSGYALWENIAGVPCSRDTAQTASWLFDAWWNSSGHKANMLQTGSDFQAGLGLAVGKPESGKVWVYASNNCMFR